MNYFHIADLLHEKEQFMSRKSYEDYFNEPGSFFNRCKRYFKSNYGKKDAWKKLQKMIMQINYVNLEQADSMIEWTTVRRLCL